MAQMSGYLNIPSEEDSLAKALNKDSGVSPAAFSSAAGSVTQAIGTVANEMIEQKKLAAALKQRRHRLMQQSQFQRDVGTSRKLVPGTQRALDLVMAGLPDEPGRPSR